MRFACKLQLNQDMKPARYEKQFLLSASLSQNINPIFRFFSLTQYQSVEGSFVITSGPKT